MSKVTETIFKGKSHLIPMADVSHIQFRKQGYNKSDSEWVSTNYAVIVMKHTKYNTEFDDYENAIYLNETEYNEFAKAYCQYRHELDEVNLGDESNE